MRREREWERVFFERAQREREMGMRELSVENAELVKSLNWMRDNSVDNILFETFSVTRPGRSNEIVRGVGVRDRVNREN